MLYGLRDPKVHRESEIDRGMKKRKKEREITILVHRRDGQSFRKPPGK